jgi:integrase
MRHSEQLPVDDLGHDVGDVITPLNTNLLNEKFVQELKQLRLPAGRDAGFTIHSWRHCFESFCICHGAPREYVDAWQGHAGISRASDLYVHVFDEESQRLMNRVTFELA